MALSLSFTGFVEEVKTFDWGSVVTVSHSNRQKNPQGEWETTSRDYIDVSVDPTSEFGWLLQAQKGTRISVSGNTKITTYPKKDGTFGIGIKVWPKDAELVEANSAPKSDKPWATSVIDPNDAPF